MDPRISFFPKRQIRVELSDWSRKRNNEGERRLRLDFMIPLIDTARDGILPAWLIDSLAAMERAESVQDNTTLRVILEGVTIELFDTPKSPNRANLFTACTLQDFVLKRTTRDKNTFPALHFNMNVKRDWPTLRFVDKYEECYLWAEFTPTDPALPSKEGNGQQMTIGDVPAATTPEPEQTPEEARANAESFLKKAQADVAAQPIEEQQAELATAGKVETMKRPRGFDPKGAA